MTDLIPIKLAVLRAAKGYLETYGWCQWVGKNDSEFRCLYSSILWGSTRVVPQDIDSLALANDVTRDVGETVEGVPSVSSVIRWNDAPRRVKKEVLNAIDATTERLIKKLEPNDKYDLVQ